MPVPDTYLVTWFFVLGLGSQAGMDSTDLFNNCRRLSIMYQPSSDHRTDRQCYTTVSSSRRMTSSGIMWKRVTENLQNDDP